MNRKLHLMNDKGVIYTVAVVAEDTDTAFKSVMDALIEDVDNNYSTEHFDSEGLVANMMKSAALKAKRNPPDSDNLTSVLIGDPIQLQHHYSVVVHHYAA